MLLPHYAELGDGSTLFVFGSESEAKKYAEESPPSSVAPEPTEDGRVSGTEAAAESTTAGGTDSVEAGSSGAEPAAAQERGEEETRHADQPAGEAHSIDMSEEQLADLKVSAPYLCICAVLRMPLKLRSAQTPILTVQLT